MGRQGIERKNILPISSVFTEQIGRFGSQKVLLVERFDRQLHSSGRYWLRLRRRRKHLRRVNKLTFREYAR